MKQFLKSPYLNLFIGILFIVGGFSDMMETLHEDIESVTFRGHHAIFLYGIVQTLAAIAGAIDGMRTLFETAE